MFGARTFSKRSSWTSATTLAETHAKGGRFRGLQGQVHATSGDEPKGEWPHRELPSMPARFGARGTVFISPSWNRWASGGIGAPMKNIGTADGISSIDVVLAKWFHVRQ